MNKIRYKAVLSLALSVVFFLCFSLNSTATGKVIHSGSQVGGKRVALTFDDGPHPKKTDVILDILREYNIKATFFVLGMNAEKYPWIVVREAAEGHEIGNHTYSHRRLTDCTDATEEFRKTSDIIVSLTGRCPTLIRPPEGAFCEKNVEEAKNCGSDIVLWTVDTRDWAKAGVESILENVKKNVCDGSIILFHDFTTNGAHTAEALKKIIPYLLEEGYEFVSVSQLLM